jgi:hypothetical protein
MALTTVQGMTVMTIADGATTMAQGITKTLIHSIGVVTDPL